MRTCFKTKKKKKKKKQLKKKNQSLQTPWEAKLIWKDVIYLSFKAEIFTVAAQSEASTRTQYDEGARAIWDLWAFRDFD